MNDDMRQLSALTPTQLEAVHRLCVAAWDAGYDQALWERQDEAFKTRHYDAAPASKTPEDWWTEQRKTVS